VVVAAIDTGGQVPWIHTLSGEPRPADTDLLPAASSGATLH